MPPHWKQSTAQNGHAAAAWGGSGQRGEPFLVLFAGVMQMEATCESICRVRCMTSVIAAVLPCLSRVPAVND